MPDITLSSHEEIEDVTPQDVQRVLDAARLLASALSPGELQTLLSGDVGQPGDPCQTESCADIHRPRHIPPRKPS